MQDLTMKFASWVIRHRKMIVLIILAITAFFFYQLLKLSLFPKFEDLLPKNHPFIKVHQEVKDKFGGANLLSIALEVKEGDIFNPLSLTKIKYLTDQMDLLPGVNHYQVDSLAHIKTRNVRVTSGGIVYSEPLLPDKIPRTPADLARFRTQCLTNETVYGRLISFDGKAALITAGFYESRVNYGKLFTQLKRLQDQVEDNNTRLHICGQPMLYGWIHHYYPQTLFILVTTIVVLILLLGLYFRKIIGIIVPLVGASVSAVWGLGFAGMLGYNFDPLTLVVPLIITARCISHSVQVTERFLEEYEISKDKEKAAVSAMGELFLPGTIGVITDAGGILVIAVASIPVMQKLAFFCAFWGLSIIVSVLILTPVLISLLPPPHKPERHIVKPMEYYLTTMAGLSTNHKGYRIIPGVTLLLLILSLSLAPKLVIGDNRPGSPLLYPNSEYNLAAAWINKNFIGTNQFHIILSGDRPYRMKEPQALSLMERLENYLLESPSAGGGKSVATLVKTLNKIWHYNDPVWAMIPNSLSEVGGFLFMYEAGETVPRALSSYMDMEAKDALLTIYYKDTKSDTIREAVSRTQDFIRHNSSEGIQFKLAGGIIGVLAGVNEMIAYSNRWNLILVLTMVFFCIIISYGSFSATFIIMAPLAMATALCTAYMVLAHIGMNINTLPVTALGIGVGVDYSVYIVDRAGREYKRLGGDLSVAIQKAIVTSGMAVTFTATCLIGGIIFWYFLSSIRFQAEMAILLSLMMFINAFAAVTLVPSIFLLIRPRLGWHFLSKKDPL
jgi:hypothetical protein